MAICQDYILKVFLNLFKIDINPQVKTLKPFLSFIGIYKKDKAKIQ